jgi:tripartite-type tricarboxylate transporter receptor subunit TctC
MLRFLRLAAIALLAMAGVAASASAQTYPQRTVKFIIPFGPGSGTDITARMIADRLTARWGKPVVVENRPGGDGLVSITAFTGANDDHTLLFVPVGTFAVHPFTHARLPYDAGRDLLPIVNVSSIILSFTASSGSKISTLADFVAQARAEPGKLNIAAAAGNSDFLLSGFVKSQDLQVAKVPYRDIMKGPTDLAEDRIQILASSITIVQALHQAGKVRILAVTSRTRAPTAPEVPTVVEAGFPALQLDSLIGIFGPRGMPDALRESIAADVRAVAASDPVIASRLSATGMLLDIRGPREFAAGVAEIRGKLGDIANSVGIRPPVQ